MQLLILRPGPQLVMREFRSEPDDLDARPNEVDVTDRAHEFLFELITLHAGTTLADIFRLLDASPLLRMIYRRDLADELCALAREGPTATTDSGRAAHEGIEYLEIYQQWGLDTSKDEYSGMQHLELHGVGHELADDLPEQHRKKGERIEWSVSLTPLRELLSLPVKVSAEVRITEEDDAAKAWMREIRRARNTDVTLGQVIQGLLWELSFHGGPQEQQQVLDALGAVVGHLVGASDQHNVLLAIAMPAVGGDRGDAAVPRDSGERAQVEAVDQTGVLRMAMTLPPRPVNCGAPAWVDWE